MYYVRDYPYQRAVMGGTFDRLHLAHHSLLRTAATIAAEVFVGVVGDSLGKKLFAKKEHNDMIQSFHTRSTAVQQYLSSFPGIYEIEELEDPWGPAPTDTRADVIVVSYETESNGHKINQMRVKAGHKLLDIVVIPWIYEDGHLISSTRLRKTEYSENRTE